MSRVAAAFLSLCMTFSLTSIFSGINVTTTAYAAGDPDASTAGVTREADPSTMDDYTTVLNLDDPTNGSRYAGRLWTDKTVFAKGQTSPNGEYSSDTFTLREDLDGVDGETITNDADFLTVFSALGSSDVINEPVPVDLMISIDITASMINSANNGVNDSANRNNWAGSLSNGSNLSKVLNAANTLISRMRQYSDESRISVVVYWGTGYQMIPFVKGDVNFTGYSVRYDTTSRRNGAKEGETVDKVYKESNESGGLQIEEDEEVTDLRPGNPEAVLHYTISDVKDDPSTGTVESDANGFYVYDPVYGTHLRYEVENDVPQSDETDEKLYWYDYKIGDGGVDASNPTKYELYDTGELKRGSGNATNVPGTGEGTKSDLGGGTCTEAGVYTALKAVADVEDIHYKDNNDEEKNRIPAIVILGDGDTNHTLVKAGDSDSDFVPSGAQENVTIGGKWWDVYKNNNGMMKSAATATSDGNQPHNKSAVIGGVLQGAYWRAAVANKYEMKVEEVPVYTIGITADAGSTYPVLDPKTYFTDSSSYLHDYYAKVQNWKNGNNTDSIELTDGSHGGYSKGNPTSLGRSSTKYKYEAPTQENQSEYYNKYKVELNQLDLNYTNQYFSATGNDYSGIFDQIFESITQSLFVPVNGANDLGVDSSVTYMDPIGEYMEVKDVKNVVLFGKNYSVAKAGVYSYSWNQKHMNVHSSAGLLTEGWYKEDDNGNVTYGGVGTTPTGDPTSIDNASAWADGWVYRLNAKTASMYVPSLQDINVTPSEDAATEKMKNTVYTFYRIEDTDRSELQLNPAYSSGDTEEGNNANLSRLSIAKEADRQQQDNSNSAHLDSTLFPGVYALNDLRIWVEDTGDYNDSSVSDTLSNTNFDEALWINIPANMLPLRTAAISTVVAENGNIQLKYETNTNTEVSTDVTDWRTEVWRAAFKNQDLPMRVFYTVGMAEDVLTEERNIDLPKITASYLEKYKVTDGTFEDRGIDPGNVEFFTNWYSEGTYNYATDTDVGGRSYGDAVVSYSPSTENRYYMFQRAIPLYRINGDSGSQSIKDTDSDGLPDDISITPAENGKLSNETLMESLGATLVTELDQMSPSDWYYAVLDYYAPKDGNAEHKYVAVARKGSEFGSGVDGGVPGEYLCWYDASEQSETFGETTENLDNSKPTDNDNDNDKKANWVVAVKKGGLRTGVLSRNAKDKGNKGSTSPAATNNFAAGNNTRTANYYYLPTINANAESSNVTVDVYLGNNGRLYDMDALLRVTKIVDDGSGNAADASREFHYQIFLDSEEERTGKLDAIVLWRNPKNNNLWQRRFEYIDLQLDAHYCLQGANNKPIKVDINGQVSGTGQYYVYLGTNHSDGGQTFRVYNANLSENTSVTTAEAPNNGTTYSAKSVWLVTEDQLASLPGDGSVPAESTVGTRKESFSLLTVTPPASAESTEVTVDCAYAQETHYLTQQVDFDAVTDFNDLYDQEIPARLQAAHDGNPDTEKQVTIDAKYIADRTGTFTLKSGYGLLFTGLDNKTEYRVTEQLTQDDVKQGYTLQSVEHNQQYGSSITYTELQEGETGYASTNAHVQDAYATFESGQTGNHHGGGNPLCQTPEAGGSVDAQHIDEVRPDGSVRHYYFKDGVELDKKYQGDNWNLPEEMGTVLGATAHFTQNPQNAEDPKAAAQDPRAYSIFGNAELYEEAVNYINVQKMKEEVTPGAGEVVGLGEEITYNIYWESNAKDESIVTIVDPLDVGVDLLYASSSDNRIAIYGKDPVENPANAGTIKIKDKDCPFSVRYDAESHTVTWTIGREGEGNKLPAGCSGYVVLAVTVNEKAVKNWNYSEDKNAGSLGEGEDYEVKNRAQVTVNDQSYFTNTVENPTLGKTEENPGSGNPIGVGDNIQYQIHWESDRKDPSVVTVTDPLDIGVDFVKASYGDVQIQTDEQSETVTQTLSAEGTATINGIVGIPVTVTYDPNERVVTWTIGSAAQDGIKVPAGASGEVSLTVKVNEKALTTWSYEEHENSGTPGNEGEKDYEVVNRAQVQVNDHSSFTNVVENPVPEKTEETPGEGQLTGIGDEIRYKIHWEASLTDPSVVTVTDPLDIGVDLLYASSSDNRIAIYGKDPVESPANAGTITIEVEGRKESYHFAVRYDAESHSVTWTIGNEDKKLPAGCSGYVVLAVTVNEKAVQEWSYRDDSDTGVPGSGKDGRVVDRAKVSVNDHSAYTNEVVNPTPDEEKTEETPGDGVMLGIGKPIHYDINWQNYKEEETVVTIRDTLDPGVDFVSASAGIAEINTTQRTNSGTCNVQYKNVDATAANKDVPVTILYEEGTRTVTWIIGTEDAPVPARAAGQVKLNVTVNEKAKEGHSYNGQADAFTDGEDDFEVFNQARVQVGNDPEVKTNKVENPVPDKEETQVEHPNGEIENHPTLEANPGADNTYTGPYVFQGTEITYKIGWKNGHDAVADVLISDTLDPGVDFVSADNGGVYSDKTHCVTWTLKEQPAGASGVVTLVVRVNEKATLVGTVENQAQVKVGTDPYVDTQVIENPTPVVEKTEVSPGEGMQVMSGDEIDYEIKWQNYEEEPADVVIVDRLDPGADFYKAGVSENDALLQSNDQAKKPDYANLVITLKGEIAEPITLELMLTAPEGKELNPDGYEWTTDEESPVSGTWTPADNLLTLKPGTNVTVKDLPVGTLFTLRRQGDEPIVENAKLGMYGSAVTVYATVKTAGTPNPLNTPEPTPEATATPTPEPEMTPVVSATPIPEEEPTPEATATPAPEPETTPVVSATPIPEEEPSPELTPTATPQPEPEPETTPEVTSEPIPGEEPSPEDTSEPTPGGQPSPVADAAQTSPQDGNESGGSMPPSAGQTATANNSSVAALRVRTRFLHTRPNAVPFAADDPITPPAQPSDQEVAEPTLSPMPSDSPSAAPTEEPIPTPTKEPEPTQAPSPEVLGEDHLEYVLTAECEDLPASESEVPEPDGGEENSTLPSWISEQPETGYQKDASGKVTFNDETPTQEANYQDESGKVTVYYFAKSHTVVWVLESRKPGAEGRVCLSVLVNENAEKDWNYDHPGWGPSENQNDDHVRNQAGVQVGNNPEIKTSIVENPTKPEKVETEIDDQDVSRDLVADENGYIGPDVNVGDRITYRITWQNNAPDESGQLADAEITITDALDRGVDFVSASDGGTYDAASHTVTWNLGIKKPHDWGFVTLVVSVNEKAVESGLVINEATVKVGNEEQHTNRVENPVGDDGGLVVRKTVSGKDADRTKEFHFTVKLSKPNISGTYGDMEFVDGIAEFTLKDGESRTATGLPADTTYTVKEAEANQEYYETHVVGDVGEILQGEVVQSEFVNRLGDGPNKEETTPGNGQTVKVGDEITYRITWENFDAVPAVVTIRDPLDAGVDFVSASDGGVYDAATHTVTWYLGEQKPGAEGSVTLTVRVNANAVPAGIVFNQAYVKVGNNPEQETDIPQNPVDPPETPPITPPTETPPSTPSTTPSPTPPTTPPTAPPIPWWPWWPTEPTSTPTPAQSGTPAPTLDHELPPKTGDEAPIGLIVTLALAAAVGLVGTTAAFVVRRKKKSGKQPPAE